MALVVSVTKEKSRSGEVLPTLSLSAPKISEEVPEGSVRAVGGGSVGGGALAPLLKANLE